MITEIGVGLALAGTGFAGLTALSRGPDPSARIWLAFPMGAALYMVLVVVLVLISGTLRPDLAIGMTTLIGGLGVALTMIRRAWDMAALKALGVSMLLTALTVCLVRLVHLTRVTPDSLRYLLFANNLQAPDALSVVHKPDLIIRQIGLPSLHALSPLTDRRYMPSIGPLFGVSGLGFLVWFGLHVTRALTKTSRSGVLIVAATLFVVSSNRLVYDVFYINTHIQMAVYLLIGLASAWLAVHTNQPGWAVPTGLSLAAAVLLRPEAPLVAAIILVAVAASRANWSVRLAVGIPPLVTTVLWYGFILWRHGTGAGVVSLTSPSFGNMVAIGTATLILIAGGHSQLWRVVRHMDRVMLVVMGLALIGFGMSEYAVLATSIEVTILNVYHGMWMLTWPVALVTFLLALWVHRIPEGRLWTTPIVGFGLLFWLLPVLRDGAFRVGTGDSGNRILAHFLAVVVAFLILAACDFYSPSGQADSANQSNAAAI